MSFQPCPKSAEAHFQRFDGRMPPAPERFRCQRWRDVLAGMGKVDILRPRSIGALSISPQHVAVGNEGAGTDQHPARAEEAIPDRRRSTLKCRGGISLHPSDKAARASASTLWSPGWPALAISARGIVVRTDENLAPCPGRIGELVVPVLMPLTRT